MSGAAGRALTMAFVTEVRNELAAVHVGLRLLADLVPSAMFARKVSPVKWRGYPGGWRPARGLGALASSGRAKEDDDCHFRNPS